MRMASVRERRSWAIIQQPLKAWVLCVLPLMLACYKSDFEKAKEMVEKGKLYLAIEYYLSFVKNNPKSDSSAKAIYEVGHLQQTLLNEPEQAIETYKTLVTKFPMNEHTLMAQMRLAQIHKNILNQPQKALIEFDKFASTALNHKDAPFALFQMAQCYTELKKYAQAELEYQNLISKYQGYEKMDEVHFERANNAYISGDYTKALQSYSSLIRLYPQSKLHSQALFGLASTHEELDDFDQAKRYYLLAQKHYPSPHVISIRLKGLENRKQRKNSI